jgi:hypothetical protein
MEPWLLTALTALPVALVVAMVVRAQRRRRSQPLDGVTQAVYQAMTNPTGTMRDFDAGPF